MHPIERLRHVARAGDVDEALLAEEAAYALASLAFDERALVPAARRLLEFHPRCAPLWWVVAEVLGQMDPATAAEHAAMRLAEDPVADELAAALPGAAHLLTTGGERLASALRERPDLMVSILGSSRRLGIEMRRLSGFVEVEAVEERELERALGQCSLVVLEVIACTGDRLLVRPDATELVARATEHSVPLWAIAGVGRLLPPALFDELVARHAATTPGPAVGVDLEDVSDPDWAYRAGGAGEPGRPASGLVVPISAAEVVVSSEGPVRASEVRARCKGRVPAELLHGIAGR
jgi:hypothetical protein